MVMRECIPFSYKLDPEGSIDLLNSYLGERIVAINSECNYRGEVVSVRGDDKMLYLKTSEGRTQKIELGLIHRLIVPLSKVA